MFAVGCRTHRGTSNPRVLWSLETGAPLQSKRGREGSPRAKPAPGDGLLPFEGGTFRVLDREESQ